MANKRFVKPVKPIAAEPIKMMTAEDLDRVMRERGKIAKAEYVYCLAEAKRQHPEWTLKQRQAYARHAAESLFD